MKIFSIDTDKVVNALVATGRTTYDYALKQLYPLIDRLDIQRRIQNPRFYDRLKRDILKGCLMPPITLAFVRKSHASLKPRAQFSAFVNQHVDDAFVLDGIQRLSTLHRAAEEEPKSFPRSQSLFLNILVCSSTDNLLYRMITLNNGQKPMTTRHQIEILTGNIFSFDDDDEEVKLVTEKDGKRRQVGVFSQSDFVLAYMAFLSASTKIDSQKLIQERLDDLLANKILEHDPTDDEVQFTDLISFIGRMSAGSSTLDKWFKLTNNIIGFASAARGHLPAWEKISPEKMEKIIATFEEAFRAFDVSKIKLGTARRNAVAYIAANPGTMRTATVEEMTEKLVDVLE